jgi:hypothetical protein
MTAARRFLVVQALMLWQGGFFFYAAVVVPTGTDVLGSAAAQGAITSRVTDALNVIGVFGLGLICWDVAQTRDTNTRRTAARWWCWSFALVCQYVLFVLHQMMDYFMDAGRSYVVIRPAFYTVHRIYLWVSTVMWVACLFLTWWTLRAWGAEAEPGVPR